MVSILDLLFPKYCLECKKPGYYICELCLAKVPKTLIHPPGLISIWKYQGVVRKGIIALKYKFAQEVGKELVPLIISNLPHSFKPNTILTPVPLHKNRANWRGFNQAELVGQEVAKTLKIAYIPDLFIRPKATTPQAGLDRESRLRNLRGKFAVNPKYQLENFKNKHLIIFDDVATTGSTLKEVAKVGRKMGFKSVIGFTIAR